MGDLSPLQQRGASHSRSPSHDGENQLGDTYNSLTSGGQNIICDAELVSELHSEARDTPARRFSSTEGGHFLMTTGCGADSTTTFGKTCKITSNLMKTWIYMFLNILIMNLKHGWRHILTPRGQTTSKLSKSYPLRFYENWHTGVCKHPE